MVGLVSSVGLVGVTVVGDGGPTAYNEINL